MALATFTDSVVAWGTLVLALGTVGLAFFTFRLAKAATSDQRAQWRPILIAADQKVDESVAGELSIRVRNVGRGPALGVNGQLRVSGPSGAAIPGQPSICLPGEVLEVRFSEKEGLSRGLIRHFEVTYYDIGERWHTTDLTALVREQADGSKPLRLAQTFVRETGRRLGPVHGSPRARSEVERADRRPWRHGWKWLRARVGAMVDSR